MTNSMINLPLPALATLARTHYFADDTAASILADAAANDFLLPADAITDRDRLILILDADIADLIHNCDPTDLLPDLDDLDDDDYDLMIARLDDETFIFALADALLA